MKISKFEVWGSHSSVSGMWRWVAGSLDDISSHLRRPQSSKSQNLLWFINMLNYSYMHKGENQALLVVLNHT